MFTYKTFKNWLVEKSTGVKQSDGRAAMQLHEYKEYIEINEGGAYGHLSHPFEDIDLTMSDVQTMIDAAVNGSFSSDNFVQEKTDGLNIMITWKNGEVRAARNKSHLKNSGENSLSIINIHNLFAGRGEIQEAFVGAMEDLSNALAGLSKKDKTQFFEEGKKFASIEIITPAAQNTVPYGQNILVFHGIVSMDSDGDAIGEDKQAGREIGKMINAANLSAQKMFYVRGPQDLDLKALPDASKKQSYYTLKLEQLMKDSGTTYASTVYDYAVGRAHILLIDAAKSAGIVIPDSYIDPLAKRLGLEDKTFTAAQMKKELQPDVLSWFTEYEKENAKNFKKQVFRPLESIFLQLGTDVMKNVTGYLALNPTDAAVSMKKEIESVINTIRINGDEKDVKKLEDELTRVTAAGGIENIVPTEGITFMYNGKLYKFTGIFAALNQIRGILMYKK